MNEKVCIGCGGTDDLQAIYYRGPRSGGSRFVSLGSVCRACIEAKEAE